MRVSWTSPALQELEGILDFIAQRDPAAAHRLVTEIVGRTERLLSENPMLGRKGRVAETRELVTPGTPYIVVYRITVRVEVLAIVHAARAWPKNFP